MKNPNSKNIIINKIKISAKYSKKLLVLATLSLTLSGCFAEMMGDDKMMDDKKSKMYMPK